MSYLIDWLNIFLTMLFQVWDGIVTILGLISGAVFILLIGWFLALFLGQLVKKILGENNIPWERLLSGIRLSAVLRDRLGLSSDGGALLGWIVKWSLLVASFMAAIHVLGLTGINVFLNEALGFLPSAIIAAFIIFIGFFLGRFIEQVLNRVMNAVDINANIAGLAARWILVAFAVLSAAKFLNLQLDLLGPRFVDFLVFAGAIAVGFGISSRAGEWFENIKARFR